MTKLSLFAPLPIGLVTLCLLSATPSCIAQAPVGTVQSQPFMTNDAVLKLHSVGLNEDLIVATINATPGRYDTSADALIALKQAGLTDKVVGAMLVRSANAIPVGIAAVPPAASAVASTDTPSGPLDLNAKPRLYLQSESHGTNIKSRRDQSMEMSKDFEKSCPAVRISINPAMADYTVMLNHIENDFSRDNQIQIANKSGDLISRTKEGGTINGNVKKACSVIAADWAQKTGQSVALLLQSPSPGK